MQSTIPEKVVVNGTTNKNAWITRDIKKSISHKNNLYKRYIKNPSDENKIKFAQFRNKLTQMIRKARRYHFTELLAKSQGDAKKNWQVLNNVLGKGPKITVLPDVSNGERNVAAGDADLADVLNSHFASIGNNLAQNIVQPLNAFFSQFLKDGQPNSFYLMPTNDIEVSETIRSIKRSQSSGTDNICSTILKAIVNEIADPLAHCINLSLSLGSVPKMAKIAKIVPVYKSGDKNDLNNYRPISILSSLSKIFEKNCIHQTN